MNKVLLFSSYDNLIMFRINSCKNSVIFLKCKKYFWQVLSKGAVSWNNSFCMAKVTTALSYSVNLCVFSQDEVVNSIFYLPNESAPRVNNSKTIVKISNFILKSIVFFIAKILDNVHRLVQWLLIYWSWYWRISGVFLAQWYIH